METADEDWNFAKKCVGVEMPLLFSAFYASESELLERVGSLVRAFIPHLFYKSFSPEIAPYVHSPIKLIVDFMVVKEMR